jgi:signal transduction histidine kinase
LVEAGLAGFDAIVEAGEEGLKRIQGMNLRIIPSILSQAAEMNDAAEGAREHALQDVRQRIERLAATIRDMAARVRELPGTESVGTVGAKVEAEIFRILALLDKLTARLGRKRKRTARGLERAEKRLVSLEGAGLKDIRKGLKKSRKSLERIFA